MFNALARGDFGARLPHGLGEHEDVHEGVEALRADDDRRCATRLRDADGTVRLANLREASGEVVSAFRERNDVVGQTRGDVLRLLRLLFRAIEGQKKDMEGRRKRQFPKRFYKEEIARIKRAINCKSKVIYA